MRGLVRMRCTAAVACFDSGRRMREQDRRARTFTNACATASSLAQPALSRRSHNNTHTHTRDDQSGIALSPTISKNSGSRRFQATSTPAPARRTVIPVTAQTPSVATAGYRQSSKRLDYGGCSVYRPPHDQHEVCHAALTRRRSSVSPTSYRVLQNGRDCTASPSRSGADVSRTLVIPHHRLPVSLRDTHDCKYYYDENCPPCGNQSKFSGIIRPV